jgi:SAM-dependent methyltransferase
LFHGFALGWLEVCRPGPGGVHNVTMTLGSGTTNTGASSARTNIESWDRIAAKLAGEAGSPSDQIAFGSLLGGDDIPGEKDLRLLGPLAGKRVLELGCGNGRNAIALVRQGAKPIAIEPSEQLAACARRLADLEQVRIEIHTGDLADLAFLRAESVDVALSAGALSEVDDLDRVLRQVHRVLKPGAMFVAAIAHPFALCVDRSGGADGPLPLGNLTLGRSYLDEGIATVERMGETFRLPIRALSSVFAAFSRAGFAVDQLLELAPVHTADPGPRVPTTVVWRARREGQ